MSLEEQILNMAKQARAAALDLANVPTAQKNRALEELAALVLASEKSILEANARDIAAARDAGLSKALIDRLMLNPQRIAHLAESIRQVLDLPDPVGQTIEAWERPSGIRIRKVRVPIGVIAIIYEARPNVTIDCAILCLKSGNATILRGGKESFHTNTILASLIQQSLAAAGINRHAVQLIPTTDRSALNYLLKLNRYVHCVIPRGGESLIRYVTETSTIPVIKHYNGVCFVYVDEAADPPMAEEILVNAKIQRPSACNAAEQMLIHASVAQSLLPRLAKALVEKGVMLRADARTAEILSASEIPFTPAQPEDNTAEYLDLCLNIRVVDSLDEAVAIINRDGSAHSDAIVTNNRAAAEKFQAGVDSATVYWNASTRFTDGFEFGFGAEIGISTDRLHARGPMGLPELTTYKYLITGTGQIRS